MEVMLMDNRIVITGQTGFIGQNLLQQWQGKPVSLIDFRSFPANAPAMKPGDVVIHLAGIAHQHSTRPQHYYEINYEKSVELAQFVREKEASHFILMSTTKVYGADTGIFTEESPCMPSDPYGKAKYMAEREILKLQDERFTVSVVRPPLVYGPGVKGNMLQLLHLCAAGRPLPFKGIKNERSIVYVNNLLAMLEKIIETKRPGIFIPSDDKPLSTFAMLRLMKNFFHTENREIKIPSLFVKALSLVRPGMARKLFGTLVYNNELSVERLQFKNPYSTEEGFAQMVKWYKENKQIK